MDNPISSLIARSLHHVPDSASLLTLGSVPPTDRFTLQQWNNALTLVSGRRVRCMNYLQVLQTIEKMSQNK